MLYIEGLTYKITGTELTTCLYPMEKEGGGLDRALLVIDVPT